MRIKGSNFLIPFKREGKQSYLFWASNIKFLCSSLLPASKYQFQLAYQKIIELFRF
jgi:hypothetical protein